MAKGKGLLIGCGGLIALMIFLSMVSTFVGWLTRESDDQRLAREAADKRQAEEAVAAAIARLQVAQSNFELPDAAQKDVACPVPIDGRTLRITAAELAQFRADGVVPSDDLGRQPFRGSEIHAIANRTSEAGQAAGVVNQTQFLLVYVPLRYEPPVLYAEKKTFDSGIFDGFLVVIDAARGQPLCQARFRAESSDKVGGGMRLKVGGVPVTGRASLGDQIRDDFKDNVSKAANRALERISAAK